MAFRVQSQPKSPKPTPIVEGGAGGKQSLPGVTRGGVGARGGRAKQMSGARRGDPDPKRGELPLLVSSRLD